jgi:hypothetical protein
LNFIYELAFSYLLTPGCTGQEVGDLVDFIYTVSPGSSPEAGAKYPCYKHLLNECKVSVIRQTKTKLNNAWSLPLEKLPSEGGAQL